MDRLLSNDPNPTVDPWTDPTFVEGYEEFVDEDWDELEDVAVLVAGMGVPLALAA